MRLLNETIKTRAPIVCKCFWTEEIFKKKSFFFVFYRNTILKSRLFKKKQTLISNSAKHTYLSKIITLEQTYSKNFKIKLKLTDSLFFHRKSKFGLYALNIILYA